MTKIYIVVGDNGMGNSGNAVFGLYPTEALAEARVAQLKKLFADGIEGTEFVYWDIVDVGAKGADCNVLVDASQ